MSQFFPKEKRFSHLSSEVLPLPNLIEVQQNSYNWFIKEGLTELFEEISPIKDYTGKELELWFQDYYFEEPKYDEERVRNRGLSYEAPLGVGMLVAEI